MKQAHLFRSARALAVVAAWLSLAACDSSPDPSPTAPSADAAADVVADAATDADAIADASGDAADAQEPQNQPLDAAFQLAVVHPPLPADDPFAQPGAALLKVALERPQESVVEPSHTGPLVAGADLQYACTSPGACAAKAGALDFGCLAPSDCPGLVFRALQQFRFEVWHQDAKSGQADALLGRGRTVALGAVTQGAEAQLEAYVTRPNRFAPAASSAAAAKLGPGKVGASAVALPGNPAVVVVVGGATPTPGAQKVFGPGSYSEFSGAVAAYSVNTRAVAVANPPGPGQALATPRAFHASATGKTAILVAGGYVAGPNGPKLSNSVEYLDKNLHAQTSPGGVPNLKFARAGASAVQLFASDDFFLILGGEGESPCTDDQGNALDCAGNTWELWHPIQGNLAQGRLNKARWNHATVAIPGIAGGYVVLMGGQDDSQVHDTFEVVQFTSAGGVISNKGQACRTDLFEGVCESFLWEPLLQNMPSARTLAGATYATAGTGSSFAWRLMAIAGGYADAAHTKPLATFDLFDVGIGNWTAETGYPLASARGAPLVAYAQVHGKAGKLLVASGVGAAGETLTTAEVVSLADPDQGGGTPLLPLALQTDNPLPNGARVLGNAVALPTGHLLLLGGLGLGSGGLVGTGGAELWQPGD